MADAFAGLLRDARDTQRIIVAAGGYAAIGALFRELFPDRAAQPVADPVTWGVAGAAVHATLTAAGVAQRAPLVFPRADLHAAWAHVETVEAGLAGHDAVPIAIGASTINDLVKLAAHRSGRQYLCAATAASMDGYAAFGASIIKDGSKQTFACPAPRGIVADTAVLAAAPTALAAAGYGDLLAKIVAGADWILADALGVEAIHPRGWELAQSGLPALLARPEGLPARDPAVCADLITGLIRTGLAMQAARSSRPASGADHQFSHLWDMQGGGLDIAHGCKVGIGTLASAALYERLLDEGTEGLDIATRCAAWPVWERVSPAVAALHTQPDLQRTALAESAAKHPDAATLGRRLQRLRDIWPELRERLHAQLLPAAELRRRLAAAGAPCRPEQIGVSRPQLRAAHAQAHTIRRRYTILDLAAELGRSDAWLDQLFAPGGFWAD